VGSQGGGKCLAPDIVSGGTLRQWRGAKPVAVPSGVAITTRLRTTADEDRVLDLVAEHLGRLRRADLVGVSRPVPLDGRLDADGRRECVEGGSTPARRR
jgi:hypothetical protein